nr:immunoglobulin light chain junction region [Macaca mulatta]MOV83956.1 immunoglobulin light chain junction region [Macaca mulatta]
CQQYNEYPPTF